MPSRTLADICAKIKYGILATPLDELESFEVRHRARLIGLMPLFPSSFMESRCIQHKSMLKYIKQFEAAKDSPNEQALLRKVLVDKMANYFLNREIDIATLNRDCIQIGFIPQHYTLRKYTADQLKDIKKILCDYIIWDKSARQCFIQGYFSIAEKKSSSSIEYIEPQEWYTRFIRQKYVYLLQEVDFFILLGYANTHHLITDQESVTLELLSKRIYNFLLGAGGG